MLKDPLLGLSPPEYDQAQRGLRLSLLISGLLYPCWGVLVKSVYAPAPVLDPLLPRVVIAALALICVSFGWRYASVRRTLLALRPFAFLMIGHQLCLIHVNHLLPMYFAILYMMIPLMAIGFVVLPALLGLLGLSFGAMTAICLSHDHMPAAARLGLLLGTALVSGLSFLQVRQRHRAAQALRDARRQLQRAHDDLSASARAMRDILDNVGNGFFVIDGALTVQPGHTRSCLELFQIDDMAGRSLLSLLPCRAQEDRAMIALHLEQTFSDVIPPEVSLDQLPACFVVGARTLHLRGRALRGDSGQITGVLFTVTDHTELLATRRQARLNEVLVDLVRRRDAFQVFLGEAAGLLDSAAADLEAGDSVSARRALHTLKGNAGVFGLEDLSACVHAVESRPLLQARHVAEIRRHLSDFLAAHGAVLGLRLSAQPDVTRQVSAAELDELRALVEPAPAPVRAAVMGWLSRRRSLPARALLEAATAQIVRIADQQGKRVRLVLQGGDVPLDPAPMAPVLLALPHLLNNALDHGIEPPDERGDKPAEATLAVCVSRDDGLLQIEVRDDGRGIDGDTVLQRALERGQLTEEQAGRLSPQERLALIFLDGVSTADEVTQRSGRGVGMAAVQAAVAGCGGAIVVDSERGRGTRVRLRLPAP